MPLPFGKTAECSVCGEESFQQELASTNMMGSSDLDGRPPEMMRSTMDTWVESCPSCGYCATDLSEHLDHGGEIVQSPAYRDILERDDIPALAISFLAASYLYEFCHEYARAAAMAQYAAWVLDDIDSTVESKNARLKAISMIHLANEHEQAFGGSSDESTLITVDLMRRSRLFNQAEAFIEQSSFEGFDVDILELVQYERQLIANKDSSVHIEPGYTAPEYEVSEYQASEYPASDGFDL